MTPVEGLVLGLVQGLTEFLPVSSSGHLVIFQTLFGVQGPSVAFDAAVHGATLVAILVYFRERIVTVVRSREWAYVGKLALGTIPIALIGGVWREEVERAFHTPWLVPVTLAVTGAALLSLYFRRDRIRVAPVPTWTMAAVIGCAQALALMPGISRSGSTIVAALWLGLAAPAAAEFSFLLGVPAIAGAVGIQADDMLATAHGGGGLTLALGTGTAFLSGLAAMALVFHLLAREGFRRFGFYCWTVALAFAGWLWMSGSG
ncbi:MAG: undecaprenyl-diphosphate phosphatase [Gemmatimonadota bacterium]|nr:undecaprenyl-diphosphate phosphatase [Gemmatimonadota bacterium]